MLNPKELQIHNELLNACANFKNATNAIVVTPFAVARTKPYRKLQRRNLVEYIVEDLKIDSTFTFDLNRVVRAALYYPSLENALSRGDLTVSKATRILGALNAENADALIAYVSSHTYAETNRFVAEAQPAQSCRETWKQISSDQYKVTLILTAPQFELLRRVQSLDAQKQKSSRMTQAVGEALRIYIERNDPVEKAKRSQARKAKRITLIKPTAANQNDSSETPATAPKPAPSTFTFSSVSDDSVDKMALTSVDFESDSGDVLVRTTDNLGAANTVQTTNCVSGPEFVHTTNHVSAPNLVRTTKTHGRVRINADLKHAVDLKTGGRCCLVDPSGKRCNEDRWIEIHHIIPVSKGGTNALENLVHVCGPHHDLVHQLVLLIEGSGNWWSFHESSESK